MSDRIEVELDDQGRLVLPVPLAQCLGLAHGTTLIVEQVNVTDHKVILDTFRLYYLAAPAQQAQSDRLV